MFTGTKPLPADFNTNLQPRGRFPPLSLVPGGEGKVKGGNVGWRDGEFGVKSAQPKAPREEPGLRMPGSSQDTPGAPHGAG